MSTVNELLKQNYLRHHKTPQSINHVTDNLKQIIKNHLQKIKQLITSDLKTHRMEMIRCNKKWNFHSVQNRGKQIWLNLKLIKNMNHRKALAKLRSGKTLHSNGYLKIYEYASTALSAKLKMKFVSFYIVIILKILGNNWQMTSNYIKICRIRLFRWTTQIFFLFLIMLILMFVRN